MAVDYCEALYKMILNVSPKNLLMIVAAIGVGIIFFSVVTTIAHKITGSDIELSFLSFNFKIKKGEKNGKSNK